MSLFDTFFFCEINVILIKSLVGLFYVNYFDDYINYWQG